MAASQGASRRIVGKMPDLSQMETAVVCFENKPVFSRAATEQVISVNRRLLKEIETLKLKMDVEMRDYEHSKEKLLNTSEQKIKTRELEIENLKGQLKKKDDRMKDVTQENRGKQKEIGELQQYIEQLKEDVTMSKGYAQDIQTQLDCFRQEKIKLETGEAYKDKDDEILRLQTELDHLKTNLKTLDDEIIKSKETIAQQGRKLRLVDNDRFNLQLQFKEDLARVSQNMRREVDKIRDVMNHQYIEMKSLREQNEGLRDDIREVKDLIVSEMRLSNQPRRNPDMTDKRLPHVRNDKHRHH